MNHPSKNRILSLIVCTALIGIFYFIWSDFSAVPSETGKKGSASESIAVTSDAPAQQLGGADPGDSGELTVFEGPVPAIDVGEYFPAPDGSRQLQRRAGRVALRGADEPKNPGFLAELRRPGALLAGFRIEKIWPNGVIELQGPRRVVEAQLADPSLNEALLAQIRAAYPDSVALAGPVHVDAPSGEDVIAFGDVIVALKKPPASGAFEPGAFGMPAATSRPLRGTDDQYVVSLADTRPAHLLAEVARLTADPRVAWAEPDFMMQRVSMSAPNDPLFPKQWHLENSKQSGGVAGADVDALEAWKTTTGSPEIIIAIVDDGFDLDHEDLQPNLFVNPGESGALANNGIDDDGNGYIDDYRGWDFTEDDNMPGYTDRDAFNTFTFDKDAGTKHEDLQIFVGMRFFAASATHTGSSYKLSILYYEGFFGLGAGYEIYLWDNDGNSTQLAYADEGDIPEGKEALWDALVALVENDVEDGKTYFGQETVAHEIKLLVANIFGFGYKLPAHGTAVAGVAVARGNNGKGGTGIAQTARWLPVKAGFSGSTFAETIRYCYSFMGRSGSNFKGADIINMSLGGGVVSTAELTALQTAHTSGREGKGTLIFAATGNDASGWLNVEVPYGSVGDYFLLGGMLAREFEWRYVKDGAVTAGDDAVWLDAVSITSNLFGNTGTESFDDNTAEDFSTSPVNSWTIVSDEAKSIGTFNARSMKTAPLAANQTASLKLNLDLVPGTLRFKLWVSSDTSDRLEFYVDGERVFSVSGRPRTGQSPKDSMDIVLDDPDVKIRSTKRYRRLPSSAYAGVDVVIGVGGSTNHDTRVDYSQHGSQSEGLDFVTPTGFTPGNIVTTDNSGDYGYEAGDYTSTFNGTSSSTPLAAGIAALMLSVNPDLDATTARRLLQTSCDFIGSASYANDGNGGFRNDFYGYGKLNAAKAVQSALDSYGAVAPSNLAGTINGSETTLTWDYPYTARRAIIYRNSSPTLTGATPLGFWDASNVFKDFTSAYGTFYYAVRVFGPFGGQQSELSAWTPVVRPIPTPVNFRVTKGTFFDEVRVTWVPLRGVTDYLLTRRLNGGSPTQIVVNGNRYSDTNLAVGDTVAYTLVARKGGESSAPTASETGFLGVPVAVNASQGSVPGAVTLTWDPIPNALGGQVFRTESSSPPADSDDDGIPDQAPLSTFFTSGSFTDTTARDGQPYFYWVAGINADGRLTALSGPALGFTAPSPEYLDGGNSMDGDGPAFRWIDIADTGTLLRDSGDDAGSTINLPFGLPFFGATVFNDLTVSTNGYISTSATDGGADYTNDCPIPALPNTGSGGRIYPYHDDLTLDLGGGALYVQHFRYFAHSHQPRLPDGVPEALTIVQWDNVQRFGGSDPFSFQAILFPNGDIVYQYQPGHPGGASATIGVQNANGDQAVSISCNETGVIPSDIPYALLIKAPPPTFWVPASEGIVTTALDENDGALGLGTGDSLREVIFHSSPPVTVIRFDPSLADQTLTITGSPLPIGGRTLDGRDAPGLVISGGGTQRPFSEVTTFSTIKNLTLADSYAPGDGGLFHLRRSLTMINVSVIDCDSDGRGGAIATYDDGILPPNLILINTTFSSNRSSGDGGAIYLENCPDFTIVNCTFADNISLGATPGIRFVNSPTGTFRNNILVNIPPVGSLKAEVQGLTAAANLGNNIFANDLGAGNTFHPNDRIADPLLDPLAFEDGPLPVHRPRLGSPAIDGGHISAPAQDALRQVRSKDGDLDGVALPDIGAVELPQPPIIVTTPNDVTNPNDGLLSLREALVIAAGQADGSITFDTAAMGDDTLTLNASPLLLNSGNRVRIIGGAGSLIDGGRLLGYWRFNEAVNGVVRNESDFPDDLRLTGDAALTTSAVRPGYGSALNVTTASDAAQSTLAQDLRPEAQITVAAWVRPSSFNPIGGIAGYHESGASGESGYYLSTAFGGGFDWRLKTVGNPRVTLRTASNFTPNQWYFVVGTYDGRELRIYVDGKLEGAQRLSGPIDYDPGPLWGFQVGRYRTRDSNFAYAGLIDDVMVFDSSVSGEQVRTLRGLAPESITIDAAGAAQVFVVSNNTEAYFENLNLTGATNSGIVVSNGAKLSADRCTVYDNISGAGGGGIRNYGVVSMHRSTVRNNLTTTAWGGGIDNVFGGRLTLNYCTVSDNRAADGSGGGISNFSGSTLVLNHVTVSGNGASGQGGGIYIHDHEAQIFHSTITANFAGVSGSGVRNNTGNLRTSHTIFADNDGPDLTGAAVSLGHLLLTDDSEASFSGDTDTVLVDPNSGLVPILRDNGGPTRTHALSAYSPAIDAGAADPVRPVTGPFDSVAPGRLNQSPPSAGPDLLFDGNPSTVFRSYDTSLLALWDFNEAVGATAAVDQVAERSASLISGAAISADGAGRSGQPGDRALAIIGGGGSFLMSDAAFMNVAAERDAITIAFWQKRDGPITAGAAFYATSPSSVGEAGATVSSPIGGGDNRMRFETSSELFTDTSLTSASMDGVDWSQWHHVAVVKNGFQRSIYLDGALIASGTSAEPLAADFSAIFFGVGLLGLYDDLAIYDAALSESDIQRLAGGSVPPGSAEFTVSPVVGLASVNAMRLTAAPDAPAGDPAAYKLEGSLDGVTFALISEGAVPAFSARGSSQRISFPASPLYAHFRLTFAAPVEPNATAVIQLADVVLLDSPAVDQRDRPRFDDGDRDRVATVDIGAFEAQTFVVDSNFDGPPIPYGQDGPGNNWLRSALMNETPTDIIFFDNAFVGESFSMNLSPGYGALLVSQPVTLVTDNLPGGVRINGVGFSNIFEIVPDAALEAEGLFLLGANGTAIINRGNLDLRRSTISGNFAGLVNGGGLRNIGTAYLENTTFYNNAVSSFGGLGGGIYNEGRLEIRYVTITENDARQGGGIYMAPGSILVASHSIIADNEAELSGPDVFGAVQLTSFNHIGDISGSAGFGPTETFGPAKLGRLLYSGGPTPTVAPQFDSPVIDTGSPVAGDLPATDQRGSDRVYGGIVDRGAHEHNPFELLAGADVDGDGLPDVYEDHYRMDRFDPTDAALDEDLDGFSALEEFFAQTNPMDPRSRFHITSYGVIANDKFRITWASVPGVVYSVWVSEDLFRFEGLPGSTVTADTTTTSVEIDLPPDHANTGLFFRIGIGPAPDFDVRQNDLIP